MICPRNKFIFIHIPKTGGTSIEDALFTFPEVYHFLKDKNRDKPLINNAFFPLRQDGLAETIKNNPNYFLFTFVRNPWDRFVSLYRHSSRVRAEARAATQRVGMAMLTALVHLAPLAAARLALALPLRRPYTPI